VLDGPDRSSLDISPLMEARPIADWPLPNVWLGVSVEDQKRADERIPILLDTPAAVRWLSCEPLLGPIDLSKMRIPTPEGCTDHDCWAVEPLTGRMAPIIELGSGDRALDGGYQTWGKIDWVVAGGESGPGARPMHPSWARSIRDQCASAGVPFLFKQWGHTFCAKSARRRPDGYSMASSTTGTRHEDRRVRTALSRT
jgi:protein gp37